MTTNTDVKAALRQQWIETPSWAYGNSGPASRCSPKRASTTPFEKLEDAAQVHRYTGVAPSVALHIPWDRVDDYEALGKYAGELGVSIGAINPNVFQEPIIGWEASNPDASIRRKALNHLLECVEIERITGSTMLSLSFANGTIIPGQDDVRARQDRLAEALAVTYQAMPEGMRMLLEYKFFEPSFYTMDVPIWAPSMHCLALGDRAEVRRHRPPRAWNQHRIHCRESPSR